MIAPNPLEKQLRDYFARNPDESLSTADIAVKFGGRDATIRKAVAILRKQGVLRIEIVVSAAA